MDEVSTQQECQVLGSAVQRGVMVVAGMCAGSMQAVVQDPALSAFVGGMETLLDDSDPSMCVCVWACVVHTDIRVLCAWPCEVGG